MDCHPHVGSVGPMHVEDRRGGRRMSIRTFLGNAKGYLGQQSTLDGELPMTCFSARLSVSSSYL